MKNLFWSSLCLPLPIRLYCLNVTLIPLYKMFNTRPKLSLKTVFSLWHHKYYSLLISEPESHLLFIPILYCLLSQFCFCCWSKIVWKYNLGGKILIFAYRSRMKMIWRTWWHDRDEAKIHNLEAMREWEINPYYSSKYPVHSDIHLSARLYLLKVTQSSQTPQTVGN